MAKIPPELIERFVKERDLRRKLIAACSGVDHPLLKQLCDLATHKLDWIERWCNSIEVEDSLGWSITLADVDQRVEQVNRHVGTMRAMEAAAGEDHAVSARMLDLSFFVYFSNGVASWSKTQRTAYWRDRDAFEAVFDVWAAENGVAENGLEYGQNAPSAIVEEELRSQRLTRGALVPLKPKPPISANKFEHLMWKLDQEHRARLDHEHNPAFLWPDIYRHSAKKIGKGASTLRRSVDRFCQTAPHFVACDMVRGRLQRDPIIGKWLSFMYLQKSEH
jgi:hypothetical protein